MSTAAFIEFMKKENVSAYQKGNAVIFVSRSGRELSGNALSSLARDFLQKSSSDTRQRAMNILIKDAAAKLGEQDLPVFDPHPEQAVSGMWV